MVNSNPASAHSARARSAADSGQIGDMTSVKQTIWDASSPCEVTYRRIPWTSVLLSPPPEMPATSGRVAFCRVRKSEIFLDTLAGHAVHADLRQSAGQELSQITGLARAGGDVLVFQGRLLRGHDILHSHRWLTHSVASGNGRTK